MSNALQIVYRFGDAASSSTSGVFSVRLNPATLAFEQAARPSLPDWTQLDTERCPDCPLRNSATTHCPMAIALIDLLEYSSSINSFSPLAVSIEMPEREIHSTVTAQRAISSLMGLLIATCACPDVSWLRPMARFHQPLASEEETIFRATSIYLLAQYFRQKSGEEPDYSLAGLSTRYQRLHQINIAMAARLRGAIERDASVNAVILLDLFAKAMPYSVDDSVAELAYLFDAYKH